MKPELEERLIEFSILIIRITESLTTTRTGNYLAGELVKFGTSPALHYGEAQIADSGNDFIQELKRLLTDLRETLVSLKIIRRVPLTNAIELVDKAVIECTELISVFVKSIESAKQNNQNSE